MKFASMHSTVKFRAVLCCDEKVCAHFSNNGNSLEIFRNSNNAIDSHGLLFLLETVGGGI